LFVVRPGTPVELVVSLEGWSKVRDSKGDLVWIEKKYLAEKRNVIVRADRAQIRVAAEDKAALVFEAERDVVLELVEAAPAAGSRSGIATARAVSSRRRKSGACRSGRW
jgi:SH3-like domain-containing protein